VTEGEARALDLIILGDGALMLAVGYDLID